MSDGPEPIPLHPESTDDPRTLRWMIPLGYVPRLGVPSTWPPALEGLRREGIISELSTAPSCVTLQLVDGQSWRDVGDRVRDALTADLRQPSRWAWDEPVAAPLAPLAGEPLTPADADIATLTQQLIDGPAGQYIRSHGGSVELVGVCDGVVTVRLAGACATCPAASATLHRRLEGELLRAHPGVKSVVNAGVARKR